MLDWKNIYLWECPMSSGEHRNHSSLWHPGLGNQRLESGLVHKNVHLRLPFRNTLIFLRFQGDKDISKWPDVAFESQIAFAFQVICLYLNSWQILSWQLSKHFWKCLWVTLFIHQEINGSNDCQIKITQRKLQWRRGNLFSL